MCLSKLLIEPLVEIKGCDFIPLPCPLSPFHGIAGRVLYTPFLSCPLNEGSTPEGVGKPPDAEAEKRDE